jgi:hypothetical protein
MDPADPQLANDEGRRKFDALVAKYAPDVDKNDYFIAHARRCYERLPRVAVRRAVTATSELPKTIDSTVRQ